jgi:hypothetical protein
MGGSGFPLRASLAWNLDTGFPRLGKTDCDRLLPRLHRMFTSFLMVHLFPDEFSRLCRWGFAFSLRLTSPLFGLCVWHVFLTLG